jgi:hypothetical protein
MEIHKIVHGVSLISSSPVICNSYAARKQVQEKAPKQASQNCAYTILALIHLDIFGQIQPTSRGKKEYSITFIDDFSCFT